MVCVPCFIVPVLLFLWHKFIQPYVLRYWNPWAVKDADGNVVPTEFPLKCEGGVCAFSRKPVENKEILSEPKEEAKDTNTCPKDRIKAE
ncbi:hypothetical protein JYU34_015919 [Plutella xylostella]|uniref:Uncharacterized protein n=1 Tax=Plutella xylostella TaxID=51655 RepID=A0ABQ7Q511_PLUXY|nr:hypothetical protein JYU34_015919 [Plutella xylostella]